MTIWERFARGVRDAMDRDVPPRGSGSTSQSLADKLGLVRVSDEALGTELERRRRARGKTVHRRPAAGDELDAMAEARQSRLRTQSFSKAYAALEIQSGAKRSEIERAYRTLLRQYHPDRHLDDPEQHASAISLATTLTDAYLLLLQRSERR